jgi:hypothetical protein
MEAICSSELSVGFKWSTRIYIPQHTAIHNYRCENLKHYILSLFPPTRSGREFDLTIVCSFYVRHASTVQWVTSNGIKTQQHYTV